MIIINDTYDPVIVYVTVIYVAWLTYLVLDGTIIYASMISTIVCMISYWLEDPQDGRKIPNDSRIH